MPDPEERVEAVSGDGDTAVLGETMTDAGSSDRSPVVRAGTGLVGKRLAHFRIEKLLGWVGLSHASDARLRTYSKGMLQRVGIAQALIHDPQVVFLDEPMSGLDPLGRKEIRDLILRLKRDGKTVFMNTHILSDVEMVCDRVAIIVKGEIRYEGRIEDFISEENQRADVVLAGMPVELGPQLEDRFGAELRGHGQQVEARVPEKQVNDVLQTAIGAGATVVSVSPVRVSLESIFLKTVEQSEEER